VKKILLHPALFALLLFGCSAERTKVVRYDRIERVFMQDGGTYTLYVRVPGKRQVKTVTLYSGHNGEHNVFDDVPPGEPMWAETHGYSGGCNDVDGFEIHVHALQEVEGGGWNHGKGGHGQTSVIE
jgi:hypothetical protein